MLLESPLNTQGKLSVARQVSFINAISKILDSLLSVTEYISMMNFTY